MIVFVSKRIDDKTFDKFVQDVKSLRSIYTDAKIAATMKINPGNFSSRVNGAKRPGQDFINRFYQVFDKRLKDYAEIQSHAAANPGTLQLSEPKHGCQSPANTQDARLERIEESIARLDSSLTTLMERLVISHQKLIDAHLSMLGQRSERAANITAE
jgi:hypothetical protein